MKTKKKSRFRYGTLKDLLHDLLKLGFDDQDATSWNRRPLFLSTADMFVKRSASEMREIYEALLDIHNLCS